MKAHNVMWKRLLASMLAALALSALSACGSSNNNNADAGVGIDGSSGNDAGGCQSTMANCNSCVTPAQDPLNACTSAVTNCLPFDETRVPKGADGKVPMVP
jgi:hypothetical protein